MLAHQAQPRRAYWATLTPDEAAALAGSGVRSTFAAGSTLLAKRDTSGDVIVILSGFVKVVARAPAGRHVVLALLGPGDIVGELAYVGGGQRSAAVVAVNDVEALRVPRAEFAELLDRSANASNALRRTLVDRLLEADRDRLAAASMTVRQRLARLLVKLARHYGVPGPDGSLTISQLSQSELAACVGGARRTVVRELALWRERHIVSTNRLTVTVHEPQSLARAAGRDAPPP